jgi:anti-anti-sigma factor
MAGAVVPVERGEGTMTEPGVSRDGERAIVRLDGDLTAATVTRWRPALAVLANDGIRQLIVNLAATTIVDSSGIGLLLAAHNSLARNGGRIEVTNASPDVVGLFRTMRLDKHFSVSQR